MLARVLVPALGRMTTAGTLVVVGEDAHHWTRVLRLSVGDRVCLFDGEGLQAQAQVVGIEIRRDARVTVQLTEPPAAGVGADASGTIWLQGYPKSDKLERVVRQATELGAAAVWPVITKHAVARPAAEESNRTARLRGIAQSAAAQCGRADVPDVRDPVALDTALSALPREARLRIVPWEKSHDSLQTILVRAKVGPCVVLVGPEGGLHEDEVTLAERYGFQRVSLGPRIWRTETVAPALLGILSYVRGDLAGGR